jgi:hypothetical protein
VNSVRPWVALSVALAAFAVALARFVINDLLGEH